MPRFARRQPKAGPPINHAFKKAKSKSPGFHTGTSRFGTGNWGVAKASQEGTAVCRELSEEDAAQLILHFAATRPAATGSQHTTVL